jgi:hypothetical protein
VIFKSQGPPARLARLTGESFAAHVNRHRLEARCRLVDVSRLRPQAGSRTSAPSAGGKTNKLQHAVLTEAALHGGTEPDLPEEAACWQTDGFCQYALFAAAGATASRADSPYPQTCRALAKREITQCHNDQFGTPSKQSIDGGARRPFNKAATRAFSWNFSITQCDAVGKLAGIRPVAAGPGQP